jgi:carboxymethylenebutenolidase
MTILQLERAGVRLRVARPAGAGARAAVIVLHQAPGYTPQIESWLTALSEKGYLAVAPLLLHRQGIETVNPLERFGGDLAAFSAFLPEDDDTRSDVGAALAFVAVEGIALSSTALVGFSYGGRAAYLIATEQPVAAAVSFYSGGVQNENFHGNDALPGLADRTAHLKAPWLGLFGDRDFMFSPSELDEWEAALAPVDQQTQIVRYPGAGHAFDVDMPFGPGMPSPYDPTAAADSYARVHAFLDEKLSR